MNTVLYARGVFCIRNRVSDDKKKQKEKNLRDGLNGGGGSLSKRDCAPVPTHRQTQIVHYNITSTMYTYIIYIIIITTIIEEIIYTAHINTHKHTEHDE